METNYEHYKKEIDELFAKEACIGFNVVTNRVCECDDINTCAECEFDINDCGYGCANKFAMWLVSEYKDPAKNVDWSKVPVDTPVLVRDDDTDPWKQRYFAEYKKIIFIRFRVVQLRGVTTERLVLPYGDMENSPIRKTVNRRFIRKRKS